jgi:hypothetical protein
MLLNFCYGLSDLKGDEKVTIGQHYVSSGMRRKKHSSRKVYLGSDVDLGS